MMGTVLWLVLLAQVDAAPLPPVEPDAAPLEGTVVAEPQPPAVHRPWWDLSVSEATYRALLPEGPSEGNLSNVQTALFWDRYTEARRESFTLDAAQLALLGVAPVVALAGSLVVPWLGVGALGELTRMQGTPAQRLVTASYSLAPVAALVAIGAGGVAGVFFAGLVGQDARNTGNPQQPLKMTRDARRAYARSERGSWKHVAMGLSVAGVSVAAGLAAVVAPVILPFLIAPVVGAKPSDVGLAMARTLAGSGALAVWSVLGGYVAMVGITSTIPALAALMYVVQAAPIGNEDEEYVVDEDTPVPGDNRDVSDFNPLKGLFGD